MMKKNDRGGRRGKPTAKRLEPTSTARTLKNTSDVDVPPWTWARRISIEDLLAAAHLAEHARGVAPTTRLKGKLVQLGPPPPGALAEVVGHVVRRALVGFEPTAAHRAGVVTVKPRFAAAPSREGARAVLALFLKFVAKEVEPRRELAVLAMAGLLALEDHEAVCVDSFAEERSVLMPRQRFTVRGKLAHALREAATRLQLTDVRVFVLDVVGGGWVRPTRRPEKIEARIVTALNRAFMEAVPTRPVLVLLKETRPYTSGTQGRVMIVPLEGAPVFDWLASSGVAAAAAWSRGEKAKTNGQTRLVRFLKKHGLPAKREEIDVRDARER